MQRRRERLRYLRELNLAAPPAMVAAATERRLAGDWRGACAAALVDVQVDLRTVASTSGAAQAERIEADLAGLAPDLMRRFLPRSDGRLVPRATVVLSRSDEACREVRDGAGGRGPVLVAELPTSWQPVRQSITVRVTRKLPGQFHDLPDWAWHADAVADRRWVYGPDRLPWHSADGSPYPQGTGTPPEQAADRTGELERIAALLAARRPARAFEAAGFEVDDSTSSPYGPDLPTLLTRMGPALPVARAELLRLARRYGQEKFSAMWGLIGVHRFTVHRKMPSSRSDSGPWLFAVPAPAEAALLRFGDLGPDELHPLVHEALFPGRTQHWRIQVPHLPEPIRVRCGTAWHLVVATGGHLRTPHHADAEIRRELAQAATGGPVSGCAAAVRGWRTGERPVAKDVRRDRQALFALALHGDTDGLLARLADGLDPELRGPGGGTLLHWLAHVDHDRVLPVLLAAGLSVADRDLEGRTALHAAAESCAEAAMAALVAVGADPGARDQRGRTPAQVLAETRR